MSSALSCGETGIWSKTRRRWDGCNGSGISATHGIVLCGSLKLYEWCSPSAVSMENRQLFPSTFINSDEEIISRSSAISISSYKTRLHTNTSSYSPNASALLSSCSLTELPVTLQIDASLGRTPDPRHWLICFADLTTSEPLSEGKGSDKFMCTWFLSH